MLNNPSKRTPELTNNLERDHSANVSTPKKNSVIKDTAISVPVLWLNMTRSNTCNM